jgi:lysine-ketoglutarate reductase/saccharopine dehydrogenase-like protein (TIGR00300 family)
LGPAGDLTYPACMKGETSAVVEAHGHLIDSGLLNTIFDAVITHEGAFEVQRFEIGRTNNDFSELVLRVSASSSEQLDRILEALLPLGCAPVVQHDALIREADMHGAVPEDFYSTTNHRTAVRIAGRWLDVQQQRMDAIIVLTEGGTRASCRKLRDVRKGDQVVCGTDGIRIVPEFQERDRQHFAFMANEISSERRVEATVARVAQVMRDVRTRGERIVFVAGPVVVHTGGAPYFSQLIRGGWVDALLAGNAIAVHDIESCFFGTSLGVDLSQGTPVHEGHKHHMKAINRINRAGGIVPAVESGVLTSGVMYDLVTHRVPFVLAGSIRDDGPLRDTVMDLVEAQERYARLLEGAGMVVMLSSMLHAIGVGNMLPSWVKVVCVDINPAVVTKLSDRGSAQTVGVVTDVGLFLKQLATQLAG